jgi:lipopolysaccharide transport system ATP-binding protein
MLSEVAIEARALGKSFPAFAGPSDRLRYLLGRPGPHSRVLHGVDLVVRRGETLGVIGTNGSGKSTLLQLICGTLATSEGKINVRGRIVAMMELGAGFNRELTGRENVGLAAAIAGLTPAQIRERFDAIADFAGIGPSMEKPMKQYSDGMRARLAFATCAHCDADILVIDEILNVGDAAFQQKCMRYLRRFRRRGTLLFVSHDMGAVARLCDRVLWLDRGEMRGLGPPGEICRRYATFLARAAGDGREGFATGGRAAPQPTSPPPARDQGSATFGLDQEAEARGGGRLVSACLRTPGGNPVTLAAGGEELELEVSWRIERQLARPVIAFIVSDRLRQCLFADTSHFAEPDRDLAVKPGDTMSATFCFRLPYLPTGKYALGAMLFDGTPSEHVLVQRDDDFGFLEVESRHISHGLMNLAMRAVSFELEEPAAAFGGRLAELAQ